MPDKKVGVHVHRNRAQKHRGCIRLTIEALFDTRDPASFDRAAAEVATALKALLTPEEAQAVLDDFAAVGTLQRTFSP
jgi:hypothetical protein